nr:unnamed protein product [Naegleria fowleri]
MNTYTTSENNPFIASSEERETIHHDDDGDHHKNEELLKKEIEEYKATNGGKKEGDLSCTIWSVIVFFILGAIWGSAFSFIKLSVDPKFGFSSFSVVFMRLVIGGIFMVILLIVNLIRNKELRKQVNKHRGIRTIIYMMILGFFNNAVPFILVAFAEESINSGIASILDSSIPLFSIFIAHFTLKGERITIMKLIGLIVGFAGVILVCLENVIVGEKPSTDQILGYVGVTLAAASYGIASVFAKKYLNDVPGQFVACGQIISAALFALLGVLIYDLGIDSRHLSYFKHANYLAWISVVYLGVFSTGVAYVCYFYLIKTVGSVKQSMVGYLLPIFGVVEGAVLLGEWNNIPFYIPIIEVIGMILIFAGIAVVSFPSWQQLRKGAKKIATSSRSEKDLEKAIIEGPNGSTSQDQDDSNQTTTTNEASSLLNQSNSNKYYTSTSTTRQDTTIQ